MRSKRLGEAAAPCEGVHRSIWWGAPQRRPVYLQRPIRCKGAGLLSCRPFSCIGLDRTRYIAGQRREGTAPPAHCLDQRSREAVLLLQRWSSSSRSASSPSPLHW